ncbi:hypothetical protein GCM10011611_17300 [Aliidongia dinghuensis]|uniref:Uncharacterized protein n=1 Tax=Aliidongia dinghuensis TaxID=1867774 RepID=A0A8J2YS41_9PROT|nr:hypothetical protein [Aliidongia dinghuensis]GGF12198.1 hypothetical protein GCM10011611_17300 [Aliidongia dinghuensis]
MAATWFRRKRFGYGATPASWQGWLATAVLILLVAVPYSVYVALVGQEAAAPVRIGVDVALIAGYVLLAHRKTEGGWRWQWGQRR